MYIDTSRPTDLLCKKDMHMRIPYGRVQGSGYNACTGKYCIICPGGKKKKKYLDGKTKKLWTAILVSLCGVS
jgi:hypothetical protein